MLAPVAGGIRAFARRIVGLGLVALIVPAMILGSSSATISFATTPVGAPGFEPGVDIAPDGTIWVNAPTGLGGHSNLWSSSNGGSSFVETNFGNPCRRIFGGGDSDVAISPIDGKVYFFDLWVGSNAISWSSDKGQSWLCSPLSTLEADRQWLAIGGRDGAGNDTLYALYHLFAPGNLAFSRSRDGGLTWTAHKMVPDAVSASALPGQVVADGDYVGFVYADGDWMRYGWSTDAGETWQKSYLSKQKPFTAVIPSVALDPTTGNLYATWLSRTDHQIYVGRSIDGGASWQDAVKVSIDGANVYPWIAARDGKIAMAWYGNTNASGNGDPNSQTSGQWVTRYTESIDAQPDDAGSTVWRDFVTPAQASIGLVKTGPICTMGLGCNANRDLGDFLQIAIDAAGKSLIVYGDRGAKSVLAKQQ